MLQQHHADGALAGLLREQLGAQPREVEAGHDVRNDHHLVAVDLGDALLAVGGLVTASTASAWVWSTYLCGRIACRIVSTEGAGARRASCAWPAR